MSRQRGGGGLRGERQRILNGDGCAMSVDTVWMFDRKLGATQHYETIAAENATENQR